MRAKTSVDRDGCPLIFQHPRSRLAVVHHRLDGKNHSFPQFGSMAAGSVVRHLRLFVQMRPNSVADKFPNYAEAGSLHMLLHRGSYVADRVADDRLLDAAVERLL